MPSRIIRSFTILAAVLGVGFAAGSAHAGIIVTVGKPCPEIVLQKKPTQDGQRPAMFEESSDTRCVVMPDGQMKCGKAIRVDTISMVPADWRCTQVSKSVLYCETPTFGASPGAGGEGEFDPDIADDEMFEDEELEVLGCSGGGMGAGWLAGIGGIIMMLVMRRRRA